MTQKKLHVRIQTKKGLLQCVKNRCAATKHKIILSWSKVVTQIIRQDRWTKLVCEQFYGEKYIFIVYILYVRFVIPLNSFFLMLKYVGPMNRFNNLKHMQPFDAENSNKRKTRRKTFSFQLFEIHATLRNILKNKQAKHNLLYTQVKHKQK